MGFKRSRSCIPWTLALIKSAISNKCSVRRGQRLSSWRGQSQPPHWLMGSKLMDSWSIGVKCISPWTPLQNLPHVIWKVIISIYSIQPLYRLEVNEKFGLLDCLVIVSKDVLLRGLHWYTVFKILQENKWKGATKNLRVIAT